jgi:hypothetical protein
VRLSWSRFNRILRYLNPKLVLLPSATTRSAMVYLRLPKHPDSDHRGLWEVGAVPSPTFFTFGFPQFDFVDYTGKMSRGYTTFFQRILKSRMPDGRPIYTKSSLKRVLPQALEKRSSKELKKKTDEANETDEYKMYKKTKNIMRKYTIPNEAPRESSTLYSFPACGSTAS